MTNPKIQLRRGTAADLPSGGTVAGEPRFTTDIGLLYIDDGTKNVLIGGTNNTYEVNALVTYGSGSVYTDATITAALTALGTSDKATLLLTPGTWVFNENIDYSAYTNITFKLPPGAIISHGAYTLNIPNIEAGFYQIFTGAGAITIGANTTILFPEWFGAVADGATDCSAAINATLTSANTKIIKFGRGTYLCQSVLTIPYDCRMVGALRGQTIIAIKHASAHLFNAVAASMWVDFNTIYLRVDASIDAREDGSCLIHWDSTGTLTVDGCVFDGKGNSADAQGTAIRWDKGTGHRILDCNFVDNKYGVSAGQSVDVGDGGDCLIRSNIFDLTTKTDAAYAIYHDGGGGLRVFENKFLGHLIAYYGNFSVPVVTGQLSIVGNNFDMSGITVSKAILITGDGVSSFENVTITGNLFTIKNANNYGIQVYFADVGVIAGNTFLGLEGDGYGVFIGEGATDWHIAGNNFVTLACGIAVDNQATTLRISGAANHFYGCTSNVTDAGGKFSDGMKLGKITRDMTAESGNVNCTDVPFKPTSIEFIAKGPNSNSTGYSNGTLNYSTFCYGASATYSNSDTLCIEAYEDGNKHQVAAVSALLANGFTLTWTKTGSPAGGNATIYYRARR